MGIGYWMIIIKILGAILIGFILTAVVGDIVDTIEAKNNPTEEE